MQMSVNLCLNTRTTGHTYKDTCYSNSNSNSNTTNSYSYKLKVEDRESNYNTKEAPTTTTSNQPTAAFITFISHPTNSRAIKHAYFLLLYPEPTTFSLVSPRS